MRVLSKRILFALFLMGLFAVAGRADSRETLDLDGVWRFATDPGNVGEAERWFEPAVELPAMPLPGYAPEADGTIRVPGIWDNQGYGIETEKVRHNFVGKGWYKRQVEIPRSWEGRRAFLVITGASRYTKVWTNGQFLGEHIGFLSIQEYDITDFATPGNAVSITIQVDSDQRWDVDALFGACSLADFMDIEWGGIWGHVRLEARSGAWLSDLFVQPNVDESSCSVTATLNGQSSLAEKVTLEVLDAAGRRVAEGAMALEPGAESGQEIAITTPIPDAKLWTPDTPTLYTARITLWKGDEPLDGVEKRFGMRQFSIDGPYILLNGNRLMLRGYGDDHIYPEQMAMPSDKNLHLERLRTIQSYGFNHVRHHSTIMPPEYYDACDEVGMIVNAEFPICYSQFLPGVGAKWREFVPAGTDPAAATDTYRREWTAVLRQYRNHPSIMAWVMGNELGQYDALEKPTALFESIARKYDPTRFFIDSDGVNPNVLFDAKKDRATLDFYTIQYDEPGADPVNDTAKFDSPEPLKPTISHEAGNYVTFSRPDLIDQFQHNMKPFWLTDGKARLDELGFSREADQWAEKSEQLYALLHKCNIEAIRKNPFLSGYHWWLFQDYWTSSNGLVDHYFRPKSVAADFVTRFNNDVVLLQDGLQRTYRGKERLALKLLVSNFSPEPLQGNLQWEVKIGADTVAQEQRALTSPAPQGELIDCAALDLELPDVTDPVQMRITLVLNGAAGPFTNEWTSWLYPATIRPTEPSAPLFAEDTYLGQFPGWNLQPVPPSGDLESRAVYLSSWPCDPRITDALKRGAAVLLIDGAEQLMQSRPITFKTSWWRADETNMNHTGTFVYDHPVTRVIAPDGWCDDGWFHLIEGATRFNVETASARPEVVIRALPGAMAIRDYALLFEVALGKGTLLVSGLNHQRAKGRPENEWILARLIDRAAEFAPPKATWPASSLDIVSVAPEGTLPGYRRIVDNQGEDTTWYSFRDDGTRVLVCRQNRPGNKVAWETAPLPTGLASDLVTFVFAGSLGFGSEPKTEGFALDINGREALRFDLPEPTTWQSEDGRVTLRFESRRTVTVDHFGLFHLTLSSAMLTPGAPCTLAVRSLGSGSQRWFGLNPYF